MVFVVTLGLMFREVVGDRVNIRARRVPTTRHGGGRCVGMEIGVCCVVGTF